MVKKFPNTVNFIVDAVTFVSGKPVQGTQTSISQICEVQPESLNEVSYKLKENGDQIKVKFTVFVPRSANFTTLKTATKVIFDSKTYRVLSGYEKQVGAYEFYLYEGDV